MSKTYLNPKHLNWLSIAKEDCESRSLVEKEMEEGLADEKMNDLEEDGKPGEDEETEAKEVLTCAQHARLRFVCEQLGGKYRTPVVERNGDKQRYETLSDVTCDLYLLLVHR